MQFLLFLRDITPLLLISPFFSTRKRLPIVRGDNSDAEFLPQLLFYQYTRQRYFCVEVFFPCEHKALQQLRLRATALPPSHETF